MTSWSVSPPLARRPPSPLPAPLRPRATALLGLCRTWPVPGPALTCSLIAPTIGSLHRPAGRRRRIGPTPGPSVAGGEQIGGAGPGHRRPPVVHHLGLGEGHPLPARDDRGRALEHGTDPHRCEEAGLHLHIGGE